MDIADIRQGKGAGRGTGAGIEYVHVLVERFHILLRLRFRTAPRNDGAPGGEGAQLAVTGGFRIGGDDLHTGVQQVGPVVNIFRVTLADHEYDGGRVRLGVIGQTVYPAVGDQTAFTE